MMGIDEDRRGYAVAADDFHDPAVVLLRQPATAHLQGAPSVTEGTTRFFEPYRTPAETQDRRTADKLER